VLKWEGAFSSLASQVSLKANHHKESLRYGAWWLGASMEEREVSVGRMGINVGEDDHRGREGKV